MYLVHPQTWEYNRTNYLKISEDLDSIDWGNLFRNENINFMTKIFTDLFLQTMSQNIPNKIIACNDKDALWVTSPNKIITSNDKDAPWVTSPNKIITCNDKDALWATSPNKIITCNDKDGTLGYQ